MTKIFISPPFGNYFDSSFFKFSEFENFEIFSIRGSFTLFPRPGLISRILLSLRYDISRQGWINKIGLRNRGIEYGVEKYEDDDKIYCSFYINFL